MIDLHPALTDADLTRPYLDLGGRNIVWRWNGDGNVWHELHMHRLGRIEWTVWLGDLPVNTEFPDWLIGTREEVARHLSKIRRSGTDALHANRVLRQLGYDGTQHTTRPDCNCVACKG